MSTSPAQSTIPNEMLQSLYLAFELSKKHWKSVFTIGMGPMSRPSDLLQQYRKQINFQGQQVIHHGAGHHMFANVCPQFIKDELVFSSKGTAEPAQF